MEKMEMGRFICELRKEKGWTQRALAERLNVTDKAVSKWERGLAYPDISLLTTLAEVLEVSVSELLNGEREAEAVEEKNSVKRVLEYAERFAGHRGQRVRDICAAGFTGAVLLGIVVCAICDLAVNRRFTWAWYPISSCVLGWVVFWPVIKFWGRGIIASLAGLSVGIFPFLYLLSRLTGDGLVWTYGFKASIVGLVYIWAVYGLFRGLWERKWLAWAAVMVICAPVNTIINLVLGLGPGEPGLDSWTVPNCLIFGALAGLFWGLDFRARRKK